MLHGYTTSSELFTWNQICLIAISRSIFYQISQSIFYQIRFGNVSYHVYIQHYVCLPLRERHRLDYYPKCNFSIQISCINWCTIFPNQPLFCKWIWALGGLSYQYRQKLLIWQTPLKLALCVHRVWTLLHSCVKTNHQSKNIYHRNP